MGSLLRNNRDEMHTVYIIEKQSVCARARWVRQVLTPDSGMPPGLSTGQRTRRPTAWEVSFPEELSEDEADEMEVERQEQESRDGQERSESGQVRLHFLNGKRKCCSDMNDRVR
jgi:hypothetical protein